MRTKIPGAIGLALVLLAGCSHRGGGGGQPQILKCAVARLVQSPADLVPGPLARGTVNDLVLENDVMRAIVQKGGRNWFNIAEFGGNIIDALPKAANGALIGKDNFEEFVLGTNIESAPNYQTVQVLNAGGEDASGNCVPAVVRATGPDDLLDFVNGSSAIRGLNTPLFFPKSADDVDLPVTIQTDYTLDAGKRYIKIDTTLQNETASALNIYMVEYMNGSGEVEVFQSGYGFGEAFVTAPCTSCNYVVYAGHEGGSGVSYGLIHNIPTTTTVSVSGVTVLVYGRDTLLLATTPEDLQPSNANARPNFTVPASGQLTVTRYFAVGDGTVGSILDVRNEILAVTIGTLDGAVSDATGPVAGAEIAVLTSTSDFPAGRGPSLKVVNHFRTDAAGRYRGTLPPGNYTLRINAPRRLAGSPASQAVSITANQTTTQNFTVPLPGRIRVLVKHTDGSPLPAKVLLTGGVNPGDPDAAEPLNSEAVLGGALTIKTGVFGDPFADALPPSVVLAEFAVKDTGSGPVTVGDTGELLVEPGAYQLSVSRGERFSEYTASVTITEGELTTVNAQIAEVVPTPFHIFGDFHVHSFDSPDSEVTNRERVATYVSEGMDFFTSSDHDMRVDFSPVVADMNLGGWVATAPGAEVTTFDYGHFNFWPVAIETNSPDDELRNDGHSTDAKIGRGATDWGGQAPLGKDFPSAGYYVLAPQQIFDSAAQDPLATGREVVRQINHVDSHFGAAGLRIDTGQSPPKSTADPRSKRLNPAYQNPNLGNSNNYYGDNYDTLELWIGTDGVSGQNAVFTDQNLGDWFNLLNQGRRRTGMSDSDTHERRVTSLHTRNVISARPLLVDVAGKAIVANISADPHTVGDSVRAGYTSMTNAPFMIVKARNAAGAVAGLELTDAFGVQSRPLPLATPGEAVELQIDVKSPTWAEYDQILVFVNGQTVRHTDQLGQPTSPARYKLCAPAVRLDLPAGFARNTITVPNAGGAQRFETLKTANITSPNKDYWMVVMVRGTNGRSVPMWPVVPNSFTNNDGNLNSRSVTDRGVLALAVSNPIFVDANNNGVWEAPGLTGLVHQGTSLDPCPGGALPAP